MIQILTKEEIDLAQWKKLLNSSHCASFFQSKECYDAYEQLSFLEPFLYGVVEQTRLVGVACGYLISNGGLVMHFFSRRAIIPGGLLLDKNITEEALSKLLQTIQNRLYDKAIYIEIRNYNDYTIHKVDFNINRFEYLPYLNIHVDSQDHETAFLKLSSSKRRQINLTLNAGVNCELTVKEEDLKSFYLILNKTYLQKVKKPLFPYEFFETMLQKPFTRLFVVKKDDRILGGMFCVQSDKVVYEWFVCGEDDKLSKVYPSVLVTWKAIEYASLNGFLYFDFMGAGKKTEHYGVREFKLKFGGRLVEHGRFLYICKPLLYKIGKIAIQMRKIL